jgi:ABC-2 type transport system permease protein
VEITGATMLCKAVRQNLTQSVSNAAFGIYFPRFAGTIYELLSAPISPFEVGRAPPRTARSAPRAVRRSCRQSAGSRCRRLRSRLIGLIILATASLFVPLHIEHPFWMVFFLLLTALTFSLFGFVIGLWADGFEKLQNRVTARQNGGSMSME